MRKNAIKKVLFTLAGLATVPAWADALGSSDLHLMDELSVEQRVVVYKQVVDFLRLNPELAADSKVIAVDGKGSVYVLDEKMVPLARAGAPSCFAE